PFQFIGSDYSLACSQLFGPVAQYVQSSYIGRSPIIVPRLQIIIASACLSPNGIQHAVINDETGVLGMTASSKVQKFGEESRPKRPNRVSLWPKDSERFSRMPTGNSGCVSKQNCRPVRIFSNCLNSLYVIAVSVASTPQQCVPK